MTITSTDLDLAGTIFVAINRALKAEGFSDSEAFHVADRGARLLAAPETPQLEAALRAADHSRLPSKTMTAFDDLIAKLDGLNRILRQTTWMIGGLGGWTLLLLAVTLYKKFFL